MGPGVSETTVGVSVGVAGSVVNTGVGVGVTVGVLVCVHPAARTNTVQSTSTDAITNLLFIPDNFPVVYFMLLFLLSATIMDS